MTPLRLTRNQSRQVDRIAVEEYGIPSIVLMENAAFGLYQLLARLFLDDLRIGSTILCGKGNNGGDGLALARHLVANLKPVRVILTDPPDQFTGDAAVQLNIVRRIGVSIEDGHATPRFLKTPPYLVDTAPISRVVVDAVHGTGFRPPSRIDFRAINARVRAGGGKVLAVDLPSGMDADTGEVIDENAIEANITATMAAEKAAFARPGIGRYIGDVHVVNLGLPWEAVTRASFASV